MFKRSGKTLVAGILSFSLLFSGVGVMGNNLNVSADEEDTGFMDVLTEDDITLRFNWNDKSNIGDERKIEFADGSKMTVVDNGTMRTDLDSQTLVDDEMGSGINLGNTLEAVLDCATKADAKGTDFDKAWEQPETTQAYIDEIHSYGINTIRIPVAWSNGDIDDGTYTIRTEMMDRVEQIVNYALNDGMYVIINDHWDNQWWGQFGACYKNEDGEKVVDEETRANAWVRYERYWTQIAERFSGYSDHLIFEGANEELCERLNDSIVVSDCPYKGYAKPDNSKNDVVACSGNLKDDEIRKMVNDINQKFVDVIRGTGGNNTNRFLLIPGYATNIEKTCGDEYVMPKDIEENGTKRLLLSVHYYSPTSFALDNGSGYYTEKDQTDMNNSFANLKKFSDAGYGIILGEHGVVTPSKVTGSVSQWLYDVFTNCKKYHVVPCLWETGNYFDRTAPQLMYHDIAVLYNTVNSATGDTSMTTDSGGAVFEDADVEGGIPGYLDSSIWGTTGTLKAYLFYQTATWDYRNAYTPLAKAGSERTWNYVQANGSEITKEVTTVTDVQLTADGEYTISYEGFDVSGANHFNMLGISTNILASKYGGADIKITNVSVKYDGVEVGEGNYTPLVKEDDKYLDFMLINKWNSDVTYPLTELDLSEKLTLPSNSLSITFTIEGLDTVLKDIEDGTFIEPETGLSINDMNATPAPEETTAPTVTTAPTATPAAVKTATPAAATNAAATTSAVKAGDVIEVGNFKYKVVKVSEGTTKGKLSVVGLTTTGKKANKLNVKATATYENSTYNVTKLGNKAFANAKAKTIILNKKITAIPKLCFNNCKKLATLKLNVKLKSVKKNAFKGCKKKIKIKGKSAKANKKLIKKAYKKVK